MGEKTSKEKKTFLKKEFSAGGAVYKKPQNLWLVTKSAASDLYPKQVWRLPKGWVDEGETSEETALREVKEEAGVEARIIKKIGTTKYFFNAPDKGRILKFVTFYLMEWEKDLPQGFGTETSEVKWLEFEKALQKLSFKTEKETLSEAKSILETGIQASLV